MTDRQLSLTPTFRSHLDLKLYFQKSLRYCQFLPLTVSNAHYFPLPVSHIPLKAITTTIKNMEKIFKKCRFYIFIY